MLALTAGAVDAVTFLRLGKIFSSVITGNLALLGVAAGQRDTSLVVNGGLAPASHGLGAFVIGAVLGALATLHVPAAVPAAVMVPLAVAVACSLPAAVNRWASG